jgi:hypothetical protein
VAVAVQLGGGPATIVALIVTFCDGVKPWSGDALVAVPPKYAPAAMFLTSKTHFQRGLQR